jgi:Ca2+-binding EF-hand superfamily protein
MSVPSKPLNKKDLKNKLEWLFKMYDVNNDGLVEKFEVETIIDSFYKLLGDNKDSLTIKIQARIHANEIYEKLNLDKKLFITVQDFTENCMEDFKLLNLLAPSYPKTLSN